MKSDVAPPAVLVFGHVEVRISERRLCIDSQPVAVGSRAFDLLVALAARSDRLVSKDELIDLVWDGLVVEENNLQVQISALRKLLGAQAIATVPGRGYRFTLAAGAPAATAAAPQPTAPRPSLGAAGKLSTFRVLVADDNKVNRLLLCRSLELMGHEVVSVENGRVAHERLLGEPFDLLLLDLEMPELDGFELLEKRLDDDVLREVPVIVTSSLEGVAPVARCIELGADDYLHKPVNAVLLKARVDASLERKQLRDRERERLARLSRQMPQDVLASPRTINATLLAAGLHGVDTVGRSPAETMDLLGNWTALMLDAIEGAGGRAHLIGGDTIGAIFDAGQAGDRAAAAWRAALEMQGLLSAFDAEHRTLAVVIATMHIGIAAGAVLEGYAGTARRGTQVCIGPAVRRAGWLQQRAASLAIPVLIDEDSRTALTGEAAIEPVTDPPGAWAGLDGPAYAASAP